MGPLSFCLPSPTSQSMIETSSRGTLKACLVSMPHTVERFSAGLYARIGGLFYQAPDSSGECASYADFTDEVFDKVFKIFKVIQDAFMKCPDFHATCY